MAKKNSRQNNYRLDNLTDRLISHLAESMSLSRTDIITQAVRRMARQEMKGDFTAFVAAQGQEEFKS